MRLTTLLAAGAGMALVPAIAGIAAPASAASLAPSGVRCHGVPATIVGHGHVRGTSHRDVIVLTGPSTVDAGSGNDLVCGSTGRDVINAGGGNDTVYAGGGNDTVNGGTGNDSLNGEGGNDVENGGTGNDRLNGGRGADQLNGQGGADVLNGDDGNDVENGGSGNDFVNGNAGNDGLAGGTGSDSLNGGTGTDDLDGNDGTDVIDGGTGPDVLHLDGSDRRGGRADGTDAQQDDSEHAAVPADLAAALFAAGGYLKAGMAAGDITGSGSQATLPDAPTVTDPKPTSDLVKHVAWFVGSHDGHDVQLGCVDGTVDGTAYFKFRTGSHDARHADGDAPEHLGEPITTGTCATSEEHVTAPADVTATLTDASAYLAKAIADGTVTGEGSAATLPVDADTVGNPVPATAGLVTGLRWKVEDTTNGRFCVTASNDSGVTAFRYAGEIENGVLDGEIHAGACLDGPPPALGGTPPPPPHFEH